MFWFNAITTVISLAEVATPMNIVSAPVMLGISVAGNTILRLFFTSTELTVKKPLTESKN